MKQKRSDNDGVVSLVTKHWEVSPRRRRRREQTRVGGNIACFGGQTADYQGGSNVEFTRGPGGLTCNFLVAR